MENQNKEKKSQIENFLSGIGKKHTFWHWEWGLISAPKSGDREPCQFMMKLHLLNDVANDAESTQKLKITS